MAASASALLYCARLLELEGFFFGGTGKNLCGDGGNSDSVLLRTTEYY